MCVLMPDKTWNIIFCAEQDLPCCILFALFIYMFVERACSDMLLSQSISADFMWPSQGPVIKIYWSQV